MQYRRYLSGHQVAHNARDARHAGAHRTLARHIAAYEGEADCRRRFAPRLRVAVGDHHLVTAASEQFAGGAADALRATGDHRGFSGVFSCHAEPRRYSRAETGEDRAMQVKEILRVKGNRLVSIEPNGRAADAVKTMAKENLGSLVVMEGGRMTGMLTFRELLLALAQRSGSLGEVRVADIMA